MGSVEDPDLAKQNDRDAAASPLAYLPTQLLKQGFDVPPRQTAAYRSGEDQLKGSLVLPLHSTMVLPPGTRGGHLSTVCWIRITLYRRVRYPLPQPHFVSLRRSRLPVSTQRWRACLPQAWLPVLPIGLALSSSPSVKAHHACPGGNP